MWKEIYEIVGDSTMTDKVCTIMQLREKEGLSLIDGVTPIIELWEATSNGYIKDKGGMMSGGAFEYEQYRIDDIADEIDSVIKKDDYPDDVIIEFKKAVKLLRKSSIYAQRIDWLLSGDDGVESFHRRLKEELAEEIKGE